MKRICLFSAAILLAAAVPYAQAGTSLGLASGYNVFVLGAYATPGSTDIQGSVAVEGSFTATGSLSVNEVPGSGSPLPAGIVVGGSLSLAGGQLDNTNAGGAYVGQNVSSSSYFNFEHNLNYGGTLNGSNIQVDGSYNVASPTPINFSAAATALTQLSTSLEGLTANGSVVVNGSTYTLTASGCTLCVFDLTGGSFVGSAINISAPSGATVVVDVSGGSDSFTSGSINYSGGVTANDTIFNFNAATTLTTNSMTIYGSILAPHAAFTGTNGSVDGELIAGSVTGETAELESGDIFSGNLPPAVAPEPATWLLMATALLACSVIRARKARV
jgi:choice-of-anchor A domain-containing protein